MQNLQTVHFLLTMSCRTKNDLLPPPSAPANLIGEAVGNDVVLSWSANAASERVTSYNVYRSDNIGGPFTLLGSPMVVNFTDSTATPNTPYFYRVTAFNGVEGPYSAVSVTVIVDLTPPATPLNLTLTQTGATSVLLNWDDNTELDLGGYNVYARVAPAAFAKLNMTGLIPISQYQHTAALPGAGPGSTWDYRVSAVDQNANESGFLTGSIFIPTPDTSAPGTPATPVATVVSSNVQVSWAPNIETDLAGYKVYRSDDGFAAVISGGAALTSASYTDTTTVAGTPYSYKVDARDSTGNVSSKSAASNTVTRPVTQVIKDLGPYTHAGSMVPAVIHSRLVNFAYMTTNAATGSVTGTETPDSNLNLSNGTILTTRYEWNMAAGVNNSPGTQHTARGFNYAHSYDQAGSYLIQCTRTDSQGIQDVWQTTVTLAADSRTKIYVSSTGDGSSTNNGQSSSAPVSLTRAVAILNASSGNLKLLFRQGDTFAVTGSVFSITKPNIWLTSDSSFVLVSGVNPKILFSGSSSFRTFATVSTNGDNCVIEKFEIDQNFSDSTRGGDTFVRQNAGRNLLVRSIKATKTGQVIQFDDSGFSSRWCLAESVVAPNDDSMYAYTFYGPANDFVAINCSCTNSLSQHGCRHSTFSRVNYSFCSMGNKDLAGEFIKTSGDIHYGYHFYTYKSKWPYPTQAADKFQLGFTGKDATNNGFLKYCVIELCEITSGVVIMAGTTHVMIRNNIVRDDRGFLWDIGGKGTGLDSFGVPYTTINSDISIINNTCLNYDTQYGSFLQCSYNVDRFIYRNNLHIAPNIPIGTSNKSVRYNASGSAADSLPLSNEISRNLWPTQMAGAFQYKGSNFSVSAFNTLGLGNNNTTENESVDLTTFKPTFTTTSGAQLAQPVLGLWDSYNSKPRNQSDSFWSAGAYQL